MKKTTVCWVMVVSLALAGPALAQPRPAAAWEAVWVPVFYNPQTVTTVTGRWKSWKICSLGRGGNMAFRGGHPQDRSGQPHGGPGSRLVSEREKVRG